MTDKTSTPIRAILFDYGGVLAEEGFYNGLHAIAVQQGLPNPQELPRQGMDAVYDSGYVIGKGSEADFWNLMRQRTGITGTDAELTEEILSRFVLRPWMMELVHECHKQGYITGILSDQTDWLQRLDKRDGFMIAFDHLFVSYQLGKGKRDTNLFDDVARNLDLDPGAILFIDDAPGNIERASSRGFRAIQYQNRKSLLRDMESLIQAP